MNEHDISGHMEEDLPKLWALAQSVFLTRLLQSGHWWQRRHPEKVNKSEESNFTFETQQFIYPIRFHMYRAA
jgi:hypothetical protein